MRSAFKFKGAVRLSVFDSKEFKAQQAYWYQRLKEDGFKDHESPGGYLRGTERRTWERALADKAQREAYFGKAADVLLNFAFETELEREIWELHVDGLSSRKIANELKTPRATVQWKIKRVRSKARL